MEFSPRRRHSGWWVSGLFGAVALLLVVHAEGIARECRQNLAWLSLAQLALDDAAGAGDAAAAFARLQSAAAARRSDQRLARAAEWAGRRADVAAEMDEARCRTAALEQMREKLVAGALLSATEIRQLQAWKVAGVDAMADCVLFAAARLSGDTHDEFEAATNLGAREPVHLANPGSVSGDMTLEGYDWIAQSPGVQPVGQLVTYWRRPFASGERLDLKMGVVQVGQRVLRFEQVRNLIASGDMESDFAESFRSLPSPWRLAFQLQSWGPRTVTTVEEEGPRSGRVLQVRNVKDETVIYILPEFEPGRWYLFTSRMRGAAVYCTIMESVRGRNVHHFTAGASDDHKWIQLTTVFRPLERTYLGVYFGVRGEGATGQLDDVGLFEVHPPFDLMRGER